MPGESTEYLSIGKIFEQQTAERRLLTLRPRDSAAILEADTIQDARKAAMEARASLAVKYGEKLANQIALTLLGPIILPEEAFTKGELPSEEQALDVAQMHHIITHSIFAATLKDADPGLIVSVNEMLKATGEIYKKDPGAFRFFQQRENGIRAEYATLKLFSGATADNGTTFKVFLPDYNNREEVRKWELKDETDLVVVAERGNRSVAIAMDVKSSWHNRGSNLTVLDPSMNQRRMHALNPELRNFLMDQGKGNVAFATTNISSRELTPYEPVDIPKGGISLNQIKQAQQAIRNFASLPQPDARSIITTASKL